jgi:hypothetical protein
LRTATTYKEASVFFETTYTKKSVARKIRINYTTFGAPLAGRSWQNIEYRFGGAGGQEKDNEIFIGAYTAEFWEYDSRLGRRWNVDPETAHFPWQTSYSGFDNNPILLIDPNGRNANPIYDEKGDLLGTDDKGLKGKPIVMSGTNFKQGMKHEDAISKGKFLDQLPVMFNPEAKKKIELSQSTLSKRPDYDGKITLTEAGKWYREGGGKPLYADLGQVDLKFLTPADFAQNRTQGVQTLYDSEDGTVYGQIRLQYLGGGKVISDFDEYNFEMHHRGSTSSDKSTRITENFKRAMRNGATFGGRVRANHSAIDNGDSFFIFFYGKGIISPNK